jgi:hypothetical protein
MHGVKKPNSAYVWDSFYNQKVMFAHTSQREKRKATTSSISGSFPA